MRSVWIGIVAVATLASGAGCSTRAAITARDTGTREDVGPAMNDVGPADAGPRDAGARVLDAGRDGATTDAGRDASTDAGRDAGGLDAGPRPDSGLCPTGASIGLYAADMLSAHTTVHDFLVPTGVLGSVTIGGPVEDSVPPAPPMPARIPSLSELMAYDALFVWGSGTWDGNAFGDVLADYVDAGGGVVIAVFGQRDGASVGVAGRMLSASYLPYVPGSYGFAPLTLGTVSMPLHSIMDGIRTVSGPNIAYHDGVIAAGATLVASWSNGTPLVATLEPSNGRTALLGIYPVMFWDTTSDAARLMANTLRWAARCD